MSQRQPNAAATAASWGQAFSEGVFGSEQPPLPHDHIATPPGVLQNRTGLIHFRTTSSKISNQQPQSRPTSLSSLGPGPARWLPLSLRIRGYSPGMSSPSLRCWVSSEFRALFVGVSGRLTRRARRLLGGGLGRNRLGLGHSLDAHQLGLKDCTQAKGQQYKS